jgi:hypothetical protein
VKLALILLGPDDVPLSPDLTTILKVTTTKGGFLSLSLAQGRGAILLHGAIAQELSHCLELTRRKKHEN